MMTEEHNETGTLLARECRVLIIEDDNSVRRILSDTLRKHDYIVSAADSGKAALSSVSENPPDIILCDYKLPQMSGEEICKQLKGSPETAKIFFMAITGHGSPEVEERLFEAGIDEFLPKPISPHTLLLRMRVARRSVYRSRRRELSRRNILGQMDVLLLQDGGCAPGYNPVTAFLTYDFERFGRKVFCAREGFISLTSGTDSDYYRLIYNQDEYRKLESTSGVFNAVFLTNASGAQFRSERFRDFIEPQVKEQAAKNIVDRKVRTIVAIGGNGTFLGIRELAKILPEDIQVAFVPVTIDSDISGSECLGQHTAVEMGAEKIKCYMADARAHKRVYVIEMMGARGGFHALFSCLGARAHQVILPGMEPDFTTIMESLNHHDHAVIVVAEGYGQEDPIRKEQSLNAAELFVKQLQDTGITSNKRIISEPFSRDIRGAFPNNTDIALAQRLSAGTVKAIQDGESRFMFAVNAENETVLPFEEISTDNTVSRELAALANRL
ncbi:6-phosphofructokinase [Planctomycetota bacterium]